MEETVLTERRADILGLVVDEYIDTAEPVSSRALASHRRLSVSAATIRNELARLEEDGYITHPYTSAGRIPSDRGYRVYIESLMDEQPVSAEERRTVEHQLYQATGGLDEWLSLSAAILAALVENVAVVMRPRARVARLKHVQLVQLHEDSALVVAVMDDGRVQQRVLPLHTPASQPDLNERAARLNARCADRDAAVARRAAADLSDPDDAGLAAALAELIEDHRAADETYLEGVQVALEQPEFSSPERMRQAVRHLEAYELHQALPSPVELEDGTMRVLIGNENADDWLHEWSVVVAIYGDRQGPTGTVAVLGPTRMDYARTIPRVRYVATLMDSLMREVGV